MSLNSAAWADITFLGLHGGEGENGKLQATFRSAGYPFTGPDSLGCAVAMDKGFTKQVFLQSGIDTPAGACLHKNAPDHSVKSLGLDFPVVVKPCSGGSSIGVYIVNTEAEYAEALDKSFRYEDEVVIEAVYQRKRIRPAESLTERRFLRLRSSPDRFL